MNNNETPTLCISNGGQSAVNIKNMDKINGNAKMNTSAEKTATAHTLDRQTVKLPTKANYFRLFSADCGYR